MRHPFSGLRAKTRFAFNALQDAHLRKHLFWWLRSQQKDYLLRHACPWLSFDAILALRERMRPGMRVFEYGSGGSTLFWLANQAALIVSIEHDPAWFQVVSEKVQGQPTVDLRLIQPELIASPGQPYNPADPHLYQSDDAEFRDYTFQRYVSQIDAFPDAYFDIILVDGRARPSCVAHGAVKARKGGLLVLDNAERPYYLERNATHLVDFDRELFSGMTPVTPGLSTTAIFTLRC